MDNNLQAIGGLRHYSHLLSIVILPGTFIFGGWKNLIGVLRVSVLKRFYGTERSTW